MDLKNEENRWAAPTINYQYNFLNTYYFFNKNNFNSWFLNIKKPNNYNHKTTGSNKTRDL